MSALDPVPAPLTCFRLTGRDAGAFLNGLLTGDTENLSPGHGVMACLLSAQGRLVSPVFAQREAEGFLLLTPAESAAPFAAALARYLAVSDCLWEEVAGPKALFSGGEGPVGFSVGDRLLGRAGRVVISPTDRGVPAGTFEVLRVEGGLPRWGVDVTVPVYPMEVNLESTLNETKGCYLGQEIIARLLNRGKPHHQLTGLRLSAPVGLGGAVTRGGDPLGRLTSLVYSPLLQAPLGLSLLPREVSIPGQPLSVVLDGQEVSAEVVRLPLSPN